MSKLSSAEVLEHMWLRFVKHNEERYGVKLSMRGFSTDVLNHKTDAERAAKPGFDAQALSRWTNPGERENYRIPLVRIAEVGKKLEASADEIDELMSARLWELSLVNPRHEALVVGEWVADVYARTERLTPDEAAVLALYREATQHLPDGLLQSPDKKERFKAALGGFLAPTWEEFWGEHAAARMEDVAMSGGELQDIQVKQQQVLKAIFRKREQERADARTNQMRSRQTLPSQRSAKQLLKDLRSRLAG